MAPERVSGAVSLAGGRCATPLSEKGKRKSGAASRDGDVSATEATRKCAVSGKMLIKDDKKSGKWRCVASHREGRRQAGWQADRLGGRQADGYRRVAGDRQRGRWENN